MSGNAASSSTASSSTVSGNAVAPTPSPRARKPAPHLSVPVPAAAAAVSLAERSAGPVFTRDGDGWIATFTARDDELPPATTAVFLDVNCVTDRSLLDEGMMRRDTDGGAWIGSVRVPAGWRGAYTFVPTDTPVTGPADGEDAREWWIGFRRNALGDREGAAPDAPEQRLCTGRSPEGVLTSETVVLDGTPRRVGTYVPPRPGRGTVLLFDGDQVRKHRVLAAFDEVENPPARVVVVDHVSADGHERNVRATDLTANPRFRDDLLAFVGGPVVVSGCSYGGLASLFFALTRPDVVEGAACLSPSVWWHDEQERGVLDLGDADAGGEVPLLVEVGDLEWMMVAEVTEACERLGAAGHPVQCGTFAGGHDWVQWRERVPASISRLRSRGA